MSALFMKNVTFDTRKNNLQQPVMSTSLFRVVIDGQLQGNFFPTFPITVKPAHAVTCIKRSHFSCPVIEVFI